MVAEHAKGADIVVLTAGLGGGTGSALSELARVLASLELPMLTLATLPGPEESAIAKVNAVRAVNALVKVPGLTLIWVDNSRLAEQHADAALDEYFQRINATIIEPLDAWNRLNQRRGLRPIRSLDGENLRTLLMSEGVLSYAERQCSRLSVDAVVEWVVSALPSSGVVPTGSVMSDIKCLGFVVEASGDWLANTPFTALEALSERLKPALRTRRCISASTETTRARPTRQRYACWPLAPRCPRPILDIVQAARREGGLLSQKLRRSVDALELGDIGDFNLMPPRSATARAAGAARHRRPTHAPAQPLAEAVGPVARRASATLCPSAPPAGSWGHGNTRTGSRRD